MSANSDNVRQFPILSPSAGVPMGEPRYTVDQLRELARTYADERHNEARLTVQLSLSCFVEWLAKREQGKEGRDAGTDRT